MKNALIMLICIPFFVGHSQALDLQVYKSKFAGDSSVSRTILHSNLFLANATAGDLLITIYNEHGQDLGIEIGDTLTLSAIDGTTNNIYSTKQKIIALTTLLDLAGEISSFLSTNINGAGGIEVNITSNGCLEVDMTAGAAVIKNLTIHSNRLTSDSHIGAHFSWGQELQGNSSYSSIGASRAPADENDLLANVFDSSGTTLGLEDGDNITITGMVGAIPINSRSITYSQHLITIKDLLFEIQAAFNLPELDTIPPGNPSVSIVDPFIGSDAQPIPEGSLAIHGRIGTDFSLSNVKVEAENDDNDATAPTRFNANMQITQIQAASNPPLHSDSLPYEDSLVAGTILYSKRFLTTAAAEDLLVDLYDDIGRDLLIENGDTLTIYATDAAVGLQYSTKLLVAKNTKLNELMAKIQDVTSTNITGGGGVEVSIYQDGRLTIDLSGATVLIENLNVRSSSVLSDAYISNLFSWGPKIDGAQQFNYTSFGAARVPASQNELLANVFDSSGNALGLELPDPITTNGVIGTEAIDSRTIAFSSTMTVGGLLLEIQNTLNLPECDGTSQNYRSVDINPSTTSGDRHIPEGAIIIRGRIGTEFALSDVIVAAENSDADADAPIRFNQNMLFTEARAAYDTFITSDANHSITSPCDIQFSITSTHFTHCGVKITYSLPNGAVVKIDLLTPVGRVARSITNTPTHAGSYILHIDGKGLATGLYYCVLTAGKRVVAKRVVLAK